MTSDERGRFNVAEYDRHLAVNVLVTYDPQASINEVEYAIKEAARKAVRRARADLGGQ